MFTATVYVITVLLVVSVVFVIAQLRHDNSIMDSFYGPIFAIATWVTIAALTVANYSDIHWLTYAVAALVTLWAARLSFRIIRKNWGKPEDPRYAAWRTKWMKRGRLYFILRSYLQVNFLQGLIISAVSLPIILCLSPESFAHMEVAPNKPFDGTLVRMVRLPLIDVPLGQIIAGLGIFISFIGLAIETIADRQLDRFIARKKAGTEAAILMTTGLFRYSRRPNYFGESLVWWGLAITTLTLQLGMTSLFWIGFISPLLITFILTRVTGPMLEEIFLEKYPEEYQHYMQTTSYFIPWFPKK